MRRLLVLGLTVVGVQLGCGVDEADMELQSNSTSQELLPFICATSHRIIYYSDAAHTTYAGEEWCYCDWFPERDGIRTQFYEVLYMEECPFLAPNNP